MSAPLKSVRGPLGRLTASKSSPAWSQPPDGADLQTVYDWESARLAAMRSGAAKADEQAGGWYDWVPARTLSLSRREARLLGDLSSFSAEPVAIRPTGGTAVPQGPGTINVSVIIRRPGPPDIRGTYDGLCAALSAGFSALGLTTAIGARPGSFCDGDYNLLVEGQKLVGTAQRWATDGRGGSICLMHCVVLSGGDPVDLCARVEALYRAAGHPRSYDPAAHSGRVIDRANLRAALDEPLSRFIKGHDPD